MKFWKKSALCAAIFAAALSLGISANASPVTETDALTNAVSLYETLSGTEVQIPDELAVEIDNTELAKSAMLGYINLDDIYYIPEDASVRRQDFMSMLYKAIILTDESYLMSTDEADVILNGCYNNAYIDDENRIAYAFMIKQGIISDTYSQDPSAELDEEACALIMESVRAGFLKDVTITVGGADITVGANISTVTDVFGEPCRIDKTEYGFEWYVYNSDYEQFFMVGVMADRICAVFSNSIDFEYNGIAAGIDMVYTADYEDDRCFRFYPTPDGKVDSILFNSAYRGEDESAAVKRSKSLLLLDMINANRVKNGKQIYAEDSELSSEAWLAAIGTGDENDVITKSGYDIFSVYRQLVEDDSEILTKDTEYITPVGISSSNEGEGGVTASIVSDTSREVNAPESTAIEINEDDYIINKVDEVTTPVLLSPKTEDEYGGGDDITIELAMQAAEKYHIEAFDIENDCYAVNEYILTDDTSITLPREVFTDGNDYFLTVSSVTEDGESLSGEETLISYGSAYDSGVEIIAPYNEGILDDDRLDITWKSDKYHDFGVDLYNERDELVYSGVFRGENEACIEGLENGKYFLYVSALRRGSDVIKAQTNVTFTTEVPEPVISEIILDKDEVYYYIYEDEEMGLLYFYDEEFVNVKEHGTTVTKKKIIRKQVKATSGYRQLDAYRTKPVFTTGDPTVTFRSIMYDGTVGSEIVNEAAKYLGIPYVWGGTSPQGFDCSGLVQYVMNSLGISVNRVAEDQFTNGVSVKRDELMPGDLVFFERNGYIHHVGIYAGDGMMIHAPHTGEVVKYQSIDTDYYRSEYAGARRVY